MDDVRKIAGELNYAEAAALRGVFAWATLAEQERGEATLYRLGLWDARPADGKKSITFLGLAVRNHLTEQGVTAS